MDKYNKPIYKKKRFNYVINFIDDPFISDEIKNEIRQIIADYYDGSEESLTEEGQLLLGYSRGFDSYNFDNTYYFPEQDLIVVDVLTTTLTEPPKEIIY